MWSYQTAGSAQSQPLVPARLVPNTWRRLRWRQSTTALGSSGDQVKPVVDVRRKGRSPVQRGWRVNARCMHTLRVDHEPLAVTQNRGNVVPRAEAFFSTRRIRDQSFVPCSRTGETFENLQIISRTGFTFRKSCFWIADELLKPYLTIADNVCLMMCK